MPFYEFESEAGHRIEIFCLPSKCPEELNEDGHIYRRVQSAPMRLCTGKSDLREHYAEFREFQKGQGITQDRVEFTL